MFNLIKKIIAKDKQKKQDKPIKVKKIVKPKLVERFGAYEDITARSDKELEKFGKVNDLMSNSLLSFRLKSIERLEKRAVKAYLKNVASEGDIWLTNPKESPLAFKGQIKPSNDTPKSEVVAQLNEKPIKNKQNDEKNIDCNAAKKESGICYGFSLINNEKELCDKCKNCPQLKENNPKIIESEQIIVTAAKQEKE